MNRIVSRRLAALAAVTTATALGLGGVTGVAWAVDTDPPAAPLAPDLVATSDTGALSTDNVTNDATPTFDVSGVEADSTVTLYANGVAVGTAAVGSGMSWVSVTTSGLTDGGYEIRATDTDGADNTSPLSPAMAPNLIVDTTAPAAPAAPDLQAASDTGASSTDNVTDDTTPTFDVGGVESFSTVTLYANGDVVGTAEVGNGVTSVSVTASSLADGGYEIRASDTDLAGNPGPTSAAMAPNLVIETVLPPLPSVGIGESLQAGTSEPFFTGAEYMWGVDVWPPGDPSIDALTVTFAWGDGSSSTVVSTDPDASVWCDTGSGRCSVWAPHVYTAQGLYTVTVTAAQPGAEPAAMSAEVIVYDLLAGGTVKGSGTVEARSGGMYQQSFTSGTATFQISAKRRAGTAATDASLVVSVPSMVADYDGARGMTFTSRTATRPLYVKKLGRYSYEVFLERVYGTVTNSAGSAGTALATFHAIITKGQPTLVRISIWNTSAGFTYMDTAAPADTSYLAISSSDRLLTGALKVG